TRQPVSTPTSPTPLRRHLQDLVRAAQSMSPLQGSHCGRRGNPGRCPGLWLGGALGAAKAVGSSPAPALYICAHLYHLWIDGFGYGFTSLRSSVSSVLSAFVPFVLCTALVIMPACDEG